MSDRKVYGIDLGTTYSCIAHVDERGRAGVLPNAEGDMTTPSVVSFESPDNVIVGQAAKEVAAAALGNTAALANHDSLAIDL
jgi:molecular chaperone DnaK